MIETKAESVEETERKIFQKYPTRRESLGDRFYIVNVRLRPRDAWPSVLGLWYLVFGAWSLVLGLWCLVFMQNTTFEHSTEHAIKS